MNRMYKLIWSATKQQYVVVSELAKQRGGFSISTCKKKSITTRVATALVAFLLTVGFSSITVMPVQGADSKELDTSTPVETIAEAADLASSGIVGGEAYKPLEGIYGGIAIGTDSNALSGESVAIGGGATVDDNALGAVAIGTGSHVISGSLALGDYSQSNGVQSIAIGTSSEALNESAMAIGAASIADGISSIALGYGSIVHDDYAVSVGSGVDGAPEQYRKIINVTDGTIASGSHEVITGGQLFSKLGNLTFSGTNYLDNVSNLTDAATALDKAIKENTGNSGSGSVDLSPWTSAGIVGGTVDTSGQKEQGIAIGASSKTKGEGAIALGYQATVTNPFAVAIGDTALADGKWSIAVGFGTYAGEEGITIGANSGSAGKGGVAIGRGANANKLYSTALGYGASANGDDSVALGHGSLATDENVVSVGNGNTGIYRKIVNLADGTIASGSRDAVTGGQLFAKLGSLTFSGTNYLDNVSNLTDAATALDKAIKENAGSGSGSADLSNLTDAGIVGGTVDDKGEEGQGIALGNQSQTTGKGAIALGYQTVANGDNSVALGSGSVAVEANVISVGNGETGVYRKIMNVADGMIASGSHDAVTGGQLFDKIGDLGFSGNLVGKNLTEAVNELQKNISTGSGSTKIEGAITYDKENDGTLKKDSVSFDSNGTALKNVTSITGTGANNSSKVDLGTNGASISHDKSSVILDSNGASLKYNDGNGTVSGITANRDGVTVEGNAKVIGNMTIDGNLTITGNTTITDTSGTTANLGDIATNKKNLGNIAKYTQDIGILDENGDVVANVVDATISNKNVINMVDNKVGTGKLNNTNAKDLTEGINQNYAAIQNNTTAINELGTAVNTLDTRVDRVGANAAALAALHPLDYNSDIKWDFAAGYGHYKGANAVSIGTFYRPNENTMFSIGGSFGGGENMLNAGVSFKVGSGTNSISTSKTEMAKKINSLQDTIQTLISQNQQQEIEIEELKALVKQVTNDKQ